MWHSRLYKTSSALLVLFAVTHTWGMYNTTRTAAQQMVVSVMETVHFTVMGMRRTYLDFYSGFGLLLTVYLIFSAVMSWQLGQQDLTTLRKLRMLSWAFAVCHVAVAVLCWVYFFLAPGIVSTAIALCLVAAAGTSSRETGTVQ